MSKLLLSTSMVVALMAINPALHAADPKPMPVEPTFGEITVDQGQKVDTSADEGKLQSEGVIRDSEQAVGETDMKALGEEEGNFTPASKEAFEDLKSDHADLDTAIQVAREADNPDDQQDAFKKVEEKLSEVEDSANKLADELKAQNDTKGEDIAKSLASDSKNEESAQETIASDVKSLEGVDETKDEADKIAEDAKLTPDEDLKLAAEMKDKTGEIQESIDAATEIQTGLEDAGKDANADRIASLRKAIENLQAILFDIQGAQKTKTVSKK